MISKDQDRRVHQWRVDLDDPDSVPLVLFREPVFKDAEASEESPVLLRGEVARLTYAGTYGATMHGKALSEEDLGKIIAFAHGTRVRQGLLANLLCGTTVCAIDEDGETRHCPAPGVTASEPIAAEAHSTKNQEPLSSPLVEDQESYGERFEFQPGDAVLKADDRSRRGKVLRAMDRGYLIEWEGIAEPSVHSGPELEFFKGRRDGKPMWGSNEYWLEEMGSMFEWEIREVCDDLVLFGTAGPFNFTIGPAEDGSLAVFAGRSGGSSPKAYGDDIPFPRLENQSSYGEAKNACLGFFLQFYHPDDVLHGAGEGVGAHDDVRGPVALEADDIPGSEDRSR